MEGYEANTYGDRFVDVYDDWYGDVTDAGACTECLARLVAEAGGGPALELGVGTGRLALPLAARGVEVHGIDASAAMLARLRAKPGSGAIRLTEGDMAALDLPAAPAFSVIFVAFNTFFNLGTAAEQASCLARVADLLAPTGVFVLEGFVPSEPGRGGGSANVTTRQMTADEVVLTVSQHDSTAQTVSGQHIHLSESGIRMRPWHLRYATPEQLDEMAETAGLGLLWRQADWSGGRFDDQADAHISAYRRTSVRIVRTSGSSPR